MEHKDHGKPRLVKLGSLCQLNRPPSSDSDVYIGIEHIVSNKNQISHTGHIRDFATYRPFRAHDILYAKLGPAANKVWLATCNGHCSTDILPLSVTSKLVFPKYLMYVMSHSRFVKHAVSTSSGTIMPRTSWRAIQNFSVTLPPVPQQRAIASILSNVDALIGNTEKSIASHRRLMSGLLHDLTKINLKSASGSTVFLACATRETQLRDICTVIQGQSPDSMTCSNDPRFGLPFFQGKAEFGRISPTPNRWCNKPVKIAIKNDTLISVRAPVGDVNICSERCCIGRGIMAIRAQEDVDFLYLFYYLRASKNKIQRLSSGTTFMSITGKQLKGLEISIPSLRYQKCIASILSGVDACPSPRITEFGFFIIFIFFNIGTQIVVQNRKPVRVAKD